MGRINKRKFINYRIRPEDVGYDSKSGSCIVTNKTTKCDGTDGDPLVSSFLTHEE